MRTLVSLLALVLVLSCQEKNPAPEQLPDCIQSVIQEIRNGEVWNPPAQIYRYDFQGREVFYVSSRCCDLPSLVIADCDTLCAPDGGLTGRGDGRCPDFSREAKNPKLVWEDKRQN
ncbi:DUF6970 domain-containing protein [Larkinella soli]|uniref:DUF6970 domain-containing protein n=1 Tax=Larkinella soli TaxID=1770527 RepID=UPI000FFC2695|nr:hypothetical protein [Larkinella soli]